jgi:cell division protein FtsL
MMLGPGELLVILFNLLIVVLFVAVPVIVVIYLVRLRQRVHTLEARVEQLEGRQGSTSDTPSQAP